MVALQARAGRKWRTFKQLRTDALGVFRGKYPFKQTVGVVTYTFRALVKRQGEYPYEPGSSRKRQAARPRLSQLRGGAGEGSRQETLTATPSGERSFVAHDSSQPSILCLG